MLPYIYLFGQPISTYMLMSCVGFFSLWIVSRLATRKDSRVDQTQVPHIALAAMAGLFVCAHLLYGVVNIRIIINAANDHFSHVHSFFGFITLLGMVFGGMVFYGGLFGAIIGAVLYIRAMKMPYQPYLDIMAFCIPLFHGFARIGCFLGGCCYGVECKYGFVFHNSLAPDANGVTRFPVQLLESGLEFALFAVLLVLYSKRKLRGKLMYVYLLSYAVIRFCDEFLRGDAIRGFVGPVSTSQFISLLILAVVPVILIVKSLKPGKNNDSVDVEDSSSTQVLSTNEED